MFCKFVLYSYILAYILLCLWRWLVISRLPNCTTSDNWWQSSFLLSFLANKSRRPTGNKLHIVIKVDFHSVLRRLKSLFWFFVLKTTTSYTTLWNVPIPDILHKVKVPPSLKKETLRWPHSQDKIISWCVHVLGFVYGKQEEMPARVVLPSSSARPVAIKHEELQACAGRHGVCCKKILPKMTRY